MWRRIAIGSKASLTRLADAIIDAVEFDYDHLYRFVYRDSMGVMVSANHSYMEEPPSADEVRVGDLPLELGASMVFHYDFGDDWRFKVKLERVDPPADNDVQAPKILAEKGESPSQYGW